MPFGEQALAGAAGVDPWALHAQLTAGDPAAIQYLAAQFYDSAGEVEGAQLAGAHALRDVQEGYCVDGAPVVDASAEVSRTRAHLADAHRTLVAIGSQLVAVGDGLATARGGADRAMRILADELLALDRAHRLDVAATAGHGRLTPTEQQHRDAAALAAAAVVVRRAGAVVSGLVDGYQAQLTRAVRVLAGLGYVPPAALDGAASPVPGPGTAPELVAAWWRRLTATEQRALLAHDHGRLGGLSGLPSAVLDAANRARLTDHLATVGAQLSALTDDTSVAAISRRLQLERQQDEDLGILAALDSTQARLGMPVLLLRYSPGAGHTGAMVALGDPDTAAHTAVVVPGTGSDTASLSDLTDDKAIPLYDQMSATSKSVVVWIDGPEPQHALPTGGAWIPDAAFDGAAEHAAPRLAADLAGLDAAHVAAVGVRGHVTALGHSYGTYILGKALVEGASRTVDDVVFTGSPGVGVDRAAQLGVDPAHVWSGQAGDDVILFARNRFTPGADGATPEDAAFGARHFGVDGSHGHGEYFQGESLANIAHVADGTPYRVHTVAAPDYRGLRELPIDSLDGALLTPVHTAGTVLSDLLHGHPGDAVTDYVTGSLHQLRDVGNAGLDLVDPAYDAGKGLVEIGKDGYDAGTQVIESGGEALWDGASTVLGTVIHWG